jgi:hypothetical protein
MFRLFALCFCVAVVTTSGLGQTGELAVQRVELLSPWKFDQNGKTIGHDPERRENRCFDLILLERTCYGGQPLGYGNRIGENWDIFATDGGGRASRTRMVELGKYEWTDRITIPEVEPWSELKSGEQRHITIALYGSDGKPGRNGDGSYPSGPPPRVGNGKAPLNRQVTSTITMSGNSVRGDGYLPYNEVKLGHMYLVRVLNIRADHYILIRVEELVRGDKVVFTYFKFGFEIP